MGRDAGRRPGRTGGTIFPGSGLWQMAWGLVRQCDDLIFYAGEMKKPSEDFVQRRDLMFYICNKPLTLCAALRVYYGE